MYVQELNCSYIKFEIGTLDESPFFCSNLYVCYLLAGVVWRDLQCMM